MALSSRPDHFFQTTSSLGEFDRKSRKASNILGNPIKLSSKILAIAPKDDSSAYVAESASTVKEINLSDKSVKRTFRGPTAPLTSLCFNQSGVFSGCWDKTIWYFPFDSVSDDDQASVPPVRYTGHVDFVKCLMIAHLPDNTPLLISGGADCDILFWNLSQPLRPLHRLSPQARGIECLVLDPFSPPDAPVIFFSTSQREIFSFTLPSSITELKSIALKRPIIVHETSIYKLHFDADGDLWTASADKTAKHLVREDGWKADTTLVHPDFVRDIIVHERGGWVATACRDEEVRIWNRASGALYHTFSGHFEEVTSLCLLGDLILSASIDATVRSWDLSPKALSKTIDDAQNSDVDGHQKDKKADDDLELTAEEEAELRAMMESEESDLLDAMARDEQ